MGKYFLILLCWVLVPGIGINTSLATTPNDEQSPNIIIVFTDDQGYHDLGCFGNELIKTPNIDKLADEGTRFTNFHVSQPVCSASRASLLTGCYSNRIGIHGALFPHHDHGLNPEETTIAEILKEQGYATGMVGKWHLGHHKQFLPPQHGFDFYYGIPYSNDMWPEQNGRNDYPPLPLIRNNETEELLRGDQSNVTTRYTEEALNFIKEHRKDPFFLYVAHTMPHVPLFVSEKYDGTSKQGMYGDVIQEIDWSVGEIVKMLEKYKIKDNTWIIYTTDNGPWLNYGNHAGSAYPLREGKMTVWEGGVRVPCVMSWPGKIEAGRIDSANFMTIDLLPTITDLVGGKMPQHKIDGRNVAPIIFEGKDPDPEYPYAFYYRQNELQAVRSGRWKLYLPHRSRTMAGQEMGYDGKGGRYKNFQTGTELYDLKNDLGERFDLAEEQPEIVEKLMVIVEDYRNRLGDNLTEREGTENRPVGRLEN